MNGQRAHRICRRTDDTSALSSPLTSLSSLAGEEEDVPAIDPTAPLFSLEDIRVAQVRCTRSQSKLILIAHTILQLLAGLQLGCDPPRRNPEPSLTNGVNGSPLMGAGQASARRSSSRRSRGAGLGRASTMGDRDSLASVLRSEATDEYEQVNINPIVSTYSA